MAYSSNHDLSLVLILIIPLLFTASHSATFSITNHCSYTVWAAAVPGGGQELKPGEAWAITVNPGTIGRIWARTGCSFDGSGRGSCLTGNCSGVLRCQSYGEPPNTLAEYALNQFNNQDFYDISVFEGFNVPVELRPNSSSCPATRCAADITAQCPAALRVPGGCNHPCTVFKTDEYCCSSGTCLPNSYLRFFKEKCPEAYRGPRDGPPSSTVCLGGTNYTVSFCPRGTAGKPVNKFYSE